MYSRGEKQTLPRKPCFMWINTSRIPSPHFDNLTLLTLWSLFYSWHLLWKCLEYPAPSSACKLLHVQLESRALLIACCTLADFGCKAFVINFKFHSQILREHTYVFMVLSFPVWWNPYVAWVHNCMKSNSDRDSIIEGSDTKEALCCTYMLSKKAFKNPLWDKCLWSLKIEEKRFAGMGKTAGSLQESFPCKLFT